MKEVALDITEFLAQPFRTGIQRVVGELCRYWPEDIPVVPARLAPGGKLVQLPRSVLQSVAAYFENANDLGSSLKLLVRSAARFARPVSKDTRVLVPELFYDHARVNSFRKMSGAELARTYFIVHDLLPLTHPTLFAAHTQHDFLVEYFRLIRDVPNVGFVSDRTRDAYYSRLKRQSNGTRGPVLRLGSDGLGDRGTVDFEREDAFVCVGTIEPRKNHRVVLDAFEPLFRRYPRLKLIFAGRLGWVDPIFGNRVRDLARRNSQFVFAQEPTNSVIRTFIQRARATIYISSAEGYGLPPMESLWMNTPVIASQDTPSLETVGSQGVCRVDPITPEEVQRQVISLLDPDFHAAKMREAANLKLPTWELFAHQVAEWVTRD